MDDAPVGRDLELALLDRVLTEGDPAAVVVEGEPGMGKTTLWRAGVTRASAAGIAVVTASPSQPEQDLAFGGLSDLLGPRVPTLDGVLPRPQLNALRVALRLDEPGPVPIDASAIAFATLGALVALAKDSVVLVAVDDVQWLDRPTADALAFAVRRLSSSDVRLLIARRVEDGVRAEPALEGALRDVDAAVLALGPMSVGAVQRIVHERVGTPLSRPVLHRVHEASAGNPLFAIEVARALVGAPTPVAGEPLPVPAALWDLIEQRLRTLPPLTEEALRVASLVAEPTTAQLSLALGRPVDLAPAVEAGVVELDGGLIRFSHPLLASGLADRLSAEDRSALHGTLATVVESVEERAFHLLASTNGPDPAVASAVDEAAVSARARGASAAAADLFEGALGLTDTADLAARHRRLLAAGDAARDAGDWRRAELHAHAAIDLASAGSRRAEALLALAAASPVTQLVAAQEALLNADGDPRVEARAHLVVSDSEFHVDARRALASTRAALDAAVRADDPSLRAAALAAVGYLEETCLEGDPLERFDEAIALERAGAIVPSDFSPEISLATVRMWRDDHDEARAGFERAASAWSARGDGYGMTLADTHLAIVEWRAGRWDRALTHAERALTTWAGSGDPGGVSVALYCRGFLFAHLGRAEEALRDVARAREVDAPGALMSARFDWIEGHVALTRGDTARACATLARASAAFDGLGFVHPGLRLYLSDAIEAFVAEARLADAESVVEQLVELGQTHGLARASAIGLRGRGLLLAARGEVATALPELESALVPLDALPVPFEHARTWLALGTLQRRARRRRAARESLTRALSLFEALGAEPWAARTREGIGRIGGRAPSSDGLTPTERRVAALVAEGRTNKEVAATLVVSVHTVEAALTSIYRKLDVRSRTELAHKVASES